MAPKKYYAYRVFFLNLNTITTTDFNAPKNVFFSVKGLTDQ